MFLNIESCRWQVDERVLGCKASSGLQNAPYHAVDVIVMGTRDSTNPCARPSSTVAMSFWSRADVSTHCDTCPEDELVSLSSPRDIEYLRLSQSAL